MPNFTLETFLDELDKSNLLKRVTTEVDPELEISEIVNRLYEQSLENPKKKVPALLFEHVKGSQFPLAINILGNEKNLDLLIGEKSLRIGETISNAFFDFKRLAPNGEVFSWAIKHRQLLLKMRDARSKTTTSAGFKKNKMVGDQIDLSKFPIMKCWPLDAGRFITAGLVITKSPTKGDRNLGLYRLQVLGPKQIALHWQIQKGGGFHYAEAEKIDQPLDVAVVIGADPLLWLAGIMPLPEGMDEISFSGLLRGAPVSLTPCETIDLKVPSSAQIVIEGKVQPGKRAIEGPFGDHFGHYSHPAPFPVLDIQCISYKTNAIYHSAVVGKPPQEDKAMGEAVSKIFLPFVKLIKPEMVDMWSYFEAGFHNLLAVSAKQRYKKEGIKTVFGLLGEGQLSLSKVVILVDPEVDVKSFPAVLRAIRDHFKPEKDFTLLPGTAQDTLDFTGSSMNMGSKMILDATSKTQDSYRQAMSDVPNLKEVDEKILEWRNLEGSLLVVKIKDSDHVKGRSRRILHELLLKEELQNFKMIAIVSEDVDLKSDVRVIWGIFSRFDCESDIRFTQNEMDGVRPNYSGPMGIDATWKQGYPMPVEMNPETVKLVNNRWKEYGIN